MPDDTLPARKTSRRYAQMDDCCRARDLRKGAGMSDNDEIYGLEPDQPKRGPAPPTRPDTQPGGTGDPLIDAAVQRKRESNRLRDPKHNDVVRDAYLTPIIMFAVGVAIGGTVTLATEGLDQAVGFGLQYIITVPIGVAVYMLFCLLWIGFDAPIHLIALELAGIYAVVDAAKVIVFLLPFGGIVLWVVPLLMYVGLLMSRLDLDAPEAVAVGLTTFLVKFVLAIMLIAAMM